MADQAGETVNETSKPVDSGATESPAANVNGEGNVNPLLVPTNKTADQIVAEIMAEVSDEGVRKSFEKMTQLEGELQSKIENMQTSFTEKMASIQEDINKFWAIDKEYEKYHKEMDQLLDSSTEETLGSDEIKQMIKDFKEGNYKAGMQRVTPNGEAKSNALGQVVTNNSSPDVSTEDVFEDASSETSESSTLSTENLTAIGDPKKAEGKGKRVKKGEDGKSKSEGKKTSKKKGVKN